MVLVLIILIHMIAKLIPSIYTNVYTNKLTTDDLVRIDEILGSDYYALAIATTCVSYAYSVLNALRGSMEKCLNFGPKLVS